MHNNSWRDRKKLLRSVLNSNSYQPIICFNGDTTLSIMSISITTLSISGTQGLICQCNQAKCLIFLNVIENVTFLLLSYLCHYTECRFAECCGASLNVLIFILFNFDWRLYLLPPGPEIIRIIYFFILEQ
jgi:hypothetical protein